MTSCLTSHSFPCFRTAQAVVLSRNSTPHSSPTVPTNEINAVFLSSSKYMSCMRLPCSFPPFRLARSGSKRPRSLYVGRIASHCQLSPRLVQELELVCFPRLRRINALGRSGPCTPFSPTVGRKPCLSCRPDLHVLIAGSSNLCCIAPLRGI
ncbi:hypothetical protein BC827DRAFT_1252283 [Russula dissimulans]|nr:hypothetical protein BC827DRAFT_1252283 [Russula dissimulans]